MTRFVSSAAMGSGLHRSGWPYAVQLLSDLNIPYLFDHSITHNLETVKNETWCGIFHLPPKLGAASESLTYQQIFKRQNLWGHSADRLKIAFAMTEYLACHLRELLPHRIEVVKHPTQTPDILFDENAYINNEKKYLHQLGATFRNVLAIHQIPPLKINKSWSKPFYPGHIRNLKLSNKNSKRFLYNDVVTINYMSNQEFDVFLSKNIMFMEVTDASANNAVLDCLVRNTPLITNRHPAIEEYLGSEYPLFFDDLEQIPDLVDRVLDGHHYLKGLNKECVSGEYFQKQIMSFIND
jgi:hypothetical protein